MTNKPAKDEVAAAAERLNNWCKMFTWSASMCAAVEPAYATSGFVLDIETVCAAAEAQRELATVRAERDAAIANNTELQGKLAASRKLETALAEAIECVGEFVDVYGNEWHDGTPLNTKYEQWQAALAGQGEERELSPNIVARLLPILKTFARGNPLYHIGNSPELIDPLGVYALIKELEET